MTEEKLKGQLWFSPKNIDQVQPLTEFAQAMPDSCKTDDPVQAYRQYYIQEKKYMAKWTNREIPSWFV
jgi:hypothetical protein